MGLKIYYFKRSIPFTESFTANMRFNCFNAVNIRFDLIAFTLSTCFGHLFLPRRPSQFQIQLKSIAFAMKTSNSIPCLAYRHILSARRCSRFKFWLSVDGGNITAGTFYHCFCCRWTLWYIKLAHTTDTLELVKLYDIISQNTRNNHKNSPLYIFSILRMRFTPRGWLTTMATITTTVATTAPSSNSGKIPIIILHLQTCPLVPCPSVPESLHNIPKIET